ncbi:MAG: peptide chain release factor N(5)-glutamine methyltransferase [Myxococcaceae bacterium]|nr:peptide chain release factor N(5)-glutamine methyltransferase [Myxococcaceae bacterium]
MRDEQPAAAPADAWTIRRVLGWTAQHFEKKQIDSPRLTAEVLLAHVLGCDRIRLYVDLDRPLSKQELAAYRGLIERRVQGEPTAYLTGTRDFYGRAFRVDARVLIPRPETELLVEAILRHIPKDAPARLLDLCSGSGCVAVTFAAERPQASVWATDLSGDACAVARENAEALGVGARVTIRTGDLFEPLPPDARFDAIAANPPYIPSAEIPGLMIEVRKEPLLALDGGEDGLRVIRRIVAGARDRLKPGGVLAIEITEHQGEAVAQLFGAAGFEAVRVEKDLARLDRLVVGTAPQAG